VQFVTAARHPSLIRRAAGKRGMRSNTVYIQHAVCAALARDLDIPVEDLLAELPEPKGAAANFTKTKGDEGTRAGVPSAP
jgi:hypothetical protein